MKLMFLKVFSSCALFVLSSLFVMGEGFAAGKFIIDDDPGMDMALKEQLKPPKKTAGEMLDHAMWRFGSRMVVGYRWSKFACSVSSCPYHSFSLMFYPVAMAKAESPVWRMIRIGLGLEGGGETTQTREKWWMRNQVLAAVVSLGMQFPYRVTPFIDFVVALGAVHRNIYNKDLFHFTHSLGIEAGATVFPVKWLGLTATLGWRRWVIKTNPDSLYYDTFTFMTGIGF